MIRKSIIISLFLAINIAFAVGYVPPPALMPPNAAVPDAVAWGVIPISGTVPAGGGETKYIGFPNTAGTPDSDPNGQYHTSAADRTYTQKWTSTEAGTAVSINIYVGDIWAPTAAYVALYRDISGTITLVGKGEISGASTSSWTGYIVLVAEGGQSLDFTSSADLYFGLSWDTSVNCRMGYDLTGGAGLDYVASYLPATTTWTHVDDYDEGSILKYTN